MRTRTLASLAVLLLATPAAALQPDTAIGTARAMVDAIYAALPGDRFDWRAQRFTPELKALIEREARESAGEIGLFDAVPFCDCQDTDERYRATSNVQQTGPRTATARVTLVNGAPRRVTLDLVRLPGGWAIADLHSPDIPSLAGLLREHFARRR